MTTEIPEGYRPNVAIFALNSAGKILLCERSDVAGAWQLPQGGIDEGETVPQAAVRELFEEVGVSDAEVILQLSDPIRYEWPESLYVRGFRGQEQFYVAVRLRDDVVFNLGLHQQEFSSVEWVGQSVFLSRIRGFKAKAYEEALKQINFLHPGMIAA